MLVYLLKISCGDDMHSKIIILKILKQLFLSYRIYVDLIVKIK
jgi:hypothetical protein